MVYSIHFYMYQHQFLELGLGGYKYILEGEFVKKIVFLSLSIFQY